MAGIRRTDKTHPMAESFSGVRSTLEEVFHYYKSGRHCGAFPEKPYFLLSRCTHVSFSLWLAEQESEGGFFRATSPPAAFRAGLDFGELRYSEYKRRMLHADSLEDHLTNETKWFEFWMRILEQSDPSGAPLYQGFSRHILACAGRPGFLEETTGRRNRKTLDRSLKTDEVGHVMVRTMFMLEDFLRAIVGYFTLAEARTCVLEQIILLTGLLTEMRRILIWETPAKGPYTPFRDTHWRTRTSLAWLSRDKTKGVLTVVPRRDGGEIICTFSPASDSEGHGASWVRPLTSLKGTYEEALFATWSYGSGEHRDNPGQFPDVKACWTVQDTEAHRLEALSRQVDSLLEALARNPLCGRLVEAVRRPCRNGSPRWKATVLPWVYVKQLDQLLGNLTFVYREAKAVGGDDAAESVIGRLWPSGAGATDGVGLSRRQDGQGGEVARGVASQGGTFTPGAGKSMASEADPSTLDKPQLQPSSGSSEPFAPRPSTQEGNPTVPSGQAEVETTVKEPPGKLELSGEDSKANSPAPIHEENLAPTASGAMGRPERPPSAEAALSAEPTEIDTECAVVPAASEEPAPKPARRRRTRNTGCPEEMADALLRRLLEHHGGLGETINCEPLSATELQRELGWNQSKVQRALTNVFGPKPVRAYRSKCQDGTISTFLKACALGVRQSAKYDVPARSRSKSGRDKEADRGKYDQLEDLPVRKTSKASGSSTTSCAGPGRGTTRMRAKKSKVAAI